MKSKHIKIKNPMHRYSPAEVQALMDDMKLKLTDDLFFRIIALSALVLEESYGKLKKKETRLDVYADLLGEKLKKFSANPSEEEKATIARLKEVGMEIKMGR